MMSEDLIKRSDAIEHLKRWFHGKGWVLSDEDVKSILWDIPSVDRPKAKWMPSASEEWISPIADFYKCSICGKIVNLFQMRSYRFCPNCGFPIEE